MYQITNTFSKTAEFYDTQITAIVGATTIAAYEIIRRYCWHPGPVLPSKNVMSLLRKEYIACSVNQATIAYELGISQKSVSKIVQTLEKLGWVQRVKMKGTQLNPVYVLGKKITVGMQVAESYYADAIISLISREMKNIARQEPMELTKQQKRKITMEVMERHYPESKSSFHVSAEEVEPKTNDMLVYDDYAEYERLFSNE